MILLWSACWISWLLFDRNPILSPNRDHLCCLYIYLDLIQLAACRLILHAQQRIPRSPQLFWSGRERADNWVPIFMVPIFALSACQNGNGAYIHWVPIFIECLYSRDADSTEMYSHPINDSTLKVSFKQRNSWSRLYKQRMSKELRRPLHLL